MSCVSRNGLRWDCYNKESERQTSYLGWRSILIPDQRASLCNVRNANAVTEIRETRLTVAGV